MSKAKHIMILGDSYSTFRGYIPEGFSVYYSEEDTDKTDVRHVEETWWHRLLTACDLHLVRNDSWSGSTIGYTGYGGSDCSHSSSFIYRIEKLFEEGFFEQEPIDTLIVFGGTNDSWSDAPLGEAVTEAEKGDTLYSVRPAIAYLMHRLKEILPNVNILFLINTEIKPEIDDAIETVGAHVGLHVLRLSDIDKRNGHPTVLGMSQIASQVKAYIETL